MSGRENILDKEVKLQQGIPRLLRRPHRQKLAPRSPRRNVGINGVGAWMGWPDSATYNERESEYLAEEIIRWMKS